ncbi:hypothetical protein ACLBKT_09245 [Erythrobacter sp. W302b]|uniref:hypothetical protein n=1 Tax=Erythrobacter sp. W302b TaxID=3389874 RepID=UPI00396B21EB
MVQRCALQEAAERLIPFRQGRFDNLCGLYSALNAIQLAQWPMLERNAYRSRRMFQHGIAALEHRGLLHSAIKHGMDEPTWTWLTDKLLAEASRLSGARLRRVPILQKIKRSDLYGALALIDSHTRMGEPVLVELAGSYQHYTTIVGVSDNRLLLFDSYGYRWIAAASCELAHHHATARHRIVRSSAAVIRMS